MELYVVHVSFLILNVLIGKFHTAMLALLLGKHAHKIIVLLVLNDIR